MDYDYEKNTYNFINRRQFICLCADTAYTTFGKQAYGTTITLALMGFCGYESITSRRLLS